MSDDVFIAVKSAFVAQQFKEAMGPQMLSCGCGRKIPIRFMFRCFYCGEWYCRPCAAKHFGPTIQTPMKEGNA